MLYLGLDEGEVWGIDLFAADKIACSVFVQVSVGLEKGGAGRFKEELKLVQSALFVLYLMGGG